MSEDRQLTLHTPALSGDQELLVLRLDARDALSKLYEYDALLYARSDSVDFDHVLGKEMSIGLTLPPSKKERFFHGYVAGFASVGVQGDFTLYRAQIRPHLWRLTRATNSRAFQNKTVPQIIDLVLKEHGIANIEQHLGEGNRSPYLPWDYCVQYRENDFAFVSRLLEHEGIHYYFKHEKDRHVLVLADTNLSHDPIKDYEEVEYTRAHNITNRRTQCIWDWNMQQTIQPGLVSLTDYEFKTPKADLSGKSGSEVQRTHDKAVSPDYEVYDHLETVAQQDGYTPQLSEDYARIRAEELHVNYATVSAHTDARGLCTGALFKLKAGPKNTKGQQYLIVASTCSAENDTRSSGGPTHSGPLYSCSIEGIDVKHPFRPARVTPKPMIPGPQSATVVGKAGQENWTDEWGRVRIKFHWDRHDKGDETSTCWVRVSQNSAGAQWGSMFIPHLGQEVLVGFLEGDPDRPIVVGRVYNGNNKPPLTLPDNRHKSIIRDVFGTELIMDATPGAELLTLHCPRNDSLFQLGKGDGKNKGVVLSTKGDEIKYSSNARSFTLGAKIAYTQGYSWTIDRGFWGSVKGGLGFTAVVGTEIKASLGATMELKGGIAVSYLYNSSMSWGSGREFKAVKGSYTRISDKDTLLDSQATVYVTGGKQDNTMLSSNDDMLVLSFDDSDKNRCAAVTKMEADAKSSAYKVLGAATIASGLGATWQLRAANKAEERLRKDGEQPSIVAEYDRLSLGSIEDCEWASGGLAAAFAAVKTTAFKVDPPVHSSPSAKIQLQKDLVELFAGNDKESRLTLSKDGGLSVSAQKEITLSTEAGITVNASEKILIHSDVEIKLNAPTLRHRNLEVVD